MVLLRPHEAHCRGDRPRERDNHALFRTDEVAAAVRSHGTVTGPRVRFDLERGLLFPLHPSVLVEVDARAMAEESLMVLVSKPHGRVGRLAVSAYKAGLARLHCWPVCTRRPRLQARNPGERYHGSANEGQKRACNRAFLDSLPITASLVAVLDGPGLRTSRLVVGRFPEARVVVPNSFAYESIAARWGRTVPGIELVDATVEAWVASGPPRLDGIWLDYCATFGPRQRDLVVEILARGLLRPGAPLAVTWCTRRRAAVGDVGDFLAAYAPNPSRNVHISYRGMRFCLVHVG